MKKDQKFVITINRELGSGGRTIGEQLALRLNVPFYDKALIHMLQEKYGLTPEQIEVLKGQKHNWWEDFKRSMKIMPSYIAPKYVGEQINMPDFLITDDLFQSESEILKGIAEDGSCIIAGRSSFHIFRGHPNHLSIFIKASMPYRIARLVEKRGISPEQAQNIIAQVDEGRENYIKKYTNTSRYDARNYQLVLNMDDITPDEALDIIMKFIH